MTKQPKVKTRRVLIKSSPMSASGPKATELPRGSEMTLWAQAVWKGVGMGGIVSATPVSRSWSTDLNKIGSRRTLGRLMALI